MSEAVVVRSHAALHRAYADLPFDTRSDPEAAARVVSRTAGALQDRGYVLHLLREMQPDNRLALKERGLITGTFLKAEATAALLLPMEGDALVMLGGPEHVTVAAAEPGLALAQAAQACFRVEDALSGRVRFAFDEQLGYLAGESSLVGTGLRLRVLLHLPMMVRAGQIAAAATALQAKGLRMAAADGRQEGDLMEIANASAMGRTEQELCQLLTQEADGLVRQEMELRRAAQQQQPAHLSDRAFRALGILRYARLLPEKEFWRLWSDLRLGAAMGLLPLTATQADALMAEAMPAHLRAYAEESLTGEALDECRAARVRNLLGEDALK